MMKDHVRGPIKCCETLAEDMLRISRAEARVYHPHLKAVELDSTRRGRQDDLGGICASRYSEHLVCMLIKSFSVGC